MNPYSSMLQKASLEMRQFQQTHPDASYFGKDWLERFAVRLEQASGLREADAAEREILAIARMAVDSGPSSQTAMPSFNLALNVLQRKAKGRSV
jgi:hypothetical protein